MKIQHLLIGLLVLTGSTPYLFAESCEKLIISGSSCDDLKVNFDLKQCQDDPSQGAEAKLECSGEKARASFETKKFKYTAQLEKAASGWGSDQWNISSQRRMMKKDAPGREVAKEEVLVIAEEESLSAHLSGFVDAQFIYKKNSKTPGFEIYDGALYLESKYQEILKAYLDIPFAYDDSQNDDGNSFKIAKVKAQAFVEWHPTSNFMTRVGQFDTIYGFEVNDSADLAMAQTGLAFNYALPLTHTGVLGEYSGDLSNGFTGTARFMVANPQDKGLLDGGNIDLGAQLSASNEMLRGSVGYLTRNLPGPSGWRHFVDILAGISFPMTDLDFQFDLIKEPSQKTGYAFMGHVSVQPADPWGFNARFDLLSKQGFDSAYQIAAGPFYNPYKPMTLKLQYTYENTREVAGDPRSKEHSVIASAIYRF